VRKNQVLHVRTQRRPCDSSMLRILFTSYRAGVDPEATLKRFEALAHVSRGLRSVAWGKPAQVSPFVMPATVEGRPEFDQCIVFTFASAEALEACASRDPSVVRALLCSALALAHAVSQTCLPLRCHAGLSSVRAHRSHYIC
jgi:hypothetical protein